MIQGKRAEAGEEPGGEEAHRAGRILALATLEKLTKLTPMSFTELEQKVRALSTEERLKLRNLLEQIRMENDVEWQEEMAKGPGRASPSQVPVAVAGAVPFANRLCERVRLHPHPRRAPSAR